MIGGRITHRLLPRLLAVLLLVPTVAGSEPPAPWDFPRERDFADFLLRMDVVVIGRITHAGVVSRSTVGSCGQLGPYPNMLDVSVSVERAPVGLVSDTTMTLSCLFSPQFAGDPALSGRRILAWGSRDCYDNWRLSGLFCLISDSGRVDPPMHMAGTWDLGFTGGGPFLSTVLSAVRAREEQNALTLISGSTGIALVQVLNISRGGKGVLAFDCRLVGTALGRVLNVPDHLDFVLPPGCLPDVAKGDTLLLPVSDRTSAMYYRAETCPFALRTKFGFVPGLGVPVAALSRVIEQDSLGLHLVGRSE